MSRMLPAFDRDQAREFIRRAEDPAHRHPAISEEASAVIMADLLVAPACENAWRCKWDHGSGRIVSAEWICRGSHDAVMTIPSDLETGELLLHNHPNGHWPEGPIPSEDDLRSACDYAKRGIGNAIIDNSQQHFVLIRPPRYPARQIEETRFYINLWRRWGISFMRTTERRLAP